MRMECRRGNCQIVLSAVSPSWFHSLLIAGDIVDIKHFC